MLRPEGDSMLAFIPGKLLLLLSCLTFPNISLMLRPEGDSMLAFFSGDLLLLVVRTSGSLSSSMV